MKAVSNVVVTQSQIITRGLRFWIEPSLVASYTDPASTVYDLTPNRYPCSLNNNVGFNTSNRVPGFSFTGQTDYAYIDTGQSLAFNSFTLSAWVYITGVPSNNLTIFSKENAAGTAYNYKLFIDTNNQLNLQIQDINSNIYSIFGGSPGLNIWGHVVATYDANTGFAQIITNRNRNANLNLNITGNILVGDNCWIGCSANTTSDPNGLEPFDGLISQCLIYDRALTLDEVRTIYNSQRAKYRQYN